MAGQFEQRAAQAHDVCHDDGVMYDVIVVGAGPAGSSAAAALAARGHHVLLVERDGFPRHKVCGEFLSPEAQGTLNALGLGDVLRDRNPQPLPHVPLPHVPLSHVDVYAPGGQRLRRPLPGTAWGISRYALDEALAHAAVTAGATLHTGTTVTRTDIDSRQQTGHYSVTLRRDGRESTPAGRAVLNAAGRRSRAALSPQAEQRRKRSRHNHDGHHGRLIRSVGIKRHLTDLPLAPQVELYLFDGGYAGINPVEGERANLCLLVEVATFRAAGGTVDGMIAAARSANPALDARLSGARPVAETTHTVGAVDTEAHACPWQGLPNLGDAAVMLPPLFGDGMAMALRSAELCVVGADAYLRGNCTLDEWQAHYTHAWRAEFLPRVRLARGVQRVMMMPRVAGRLLSLGKRLPWAADYVVAATRGSVAPAPSAGLMSLG